MTNISSQADNDYGANLLLSYAYTIIIMFIICVYSGALMYVWMCLYIVCMTIYYVSVYLYVLFLYVCIIMH